MAPTYYLSEQCLLALPYGQFIRFGTVRDMDDIQRDAVVWCWNDCYSYFDRVTGAYIAEAPEP